MQADLFEEIHHACEESWSHYYDFEPHGVKIHYWFQKNEEKDVIFVFQHGLLSGTNSFLRMFELLSPYGSVLSFDRPGFGLTDRPLRHHPSWPTFIYPKQNELILETNALHEKFARETLTKEVLAGIEPTHEWINPYSLEFGDILTIELLKYLFGEERERWGRVIMIGHSLGGCVATQTVVRNSYYYDALILLDAALYATIPGGIVASWLFKLVGKLIIRHIIPRTTPGSMAFVSMKDTLNEDQLEMYRRIFKCPNWEESLLEFGIYQIQSKIPASVMLANVQVPTLVVTGDKDKVIPVKDSEKIFNELKQRENSITKFQQIENCGHCPHEETPEKLVDVILSFLDEAMLITNQ